MSLCLLKSRNPMGRTGARGRGALWRWGPNHSIRVIVTRWRKSSREMQKNQSTSGGGGMASNRFMQVDGRRMLEFLACKDPQFGEWKLPGVRDTTLRVEFQLNFYIKLEGKNYGRCELVQCGLYSLSRRDI